LKVGSSQPFPAFSWCGFVSNNYNIVHVKWAQIIDFFFFYHLLNILVPNCNDFYDTTPSEKSFLWLHSANSGKRGNYHSYVYVTRRWYNGDHLLIASYTYTIIRIMFCWSCNYTCRIVFTIENQYLHDDTLIIDNIASLSPHKEIVYTCADEKKKNTSIGTCVLLKDCSTRYIGSYTAKKSSSHYTRYGTK
jgi:hypothetical protein